MMFQKILAPALLGLSAFAFQSHAAAMTEEQIKDRYKAAMEQCDRLSGNAEDVCEQKAKAERDSALADREAAETTAEARRDAQETKDEAAYKVAKEKCDALSGDAKDACIDQAKARYNQ